MKLTDTACKAAKPAQKPYKRFDGGGLYLEVMPNGNKLWRLKYRYIGKERRISLGAYPLVTLSEARDERTRIKKLLIQDIDPATVKKDKKAELSRNAANTFEVVAREWFDMKSGEWSENYKTKMRLGLEKNIYPFLGHRPIADITPPELLEVLRKIEKRGSLDIAGRTKQICGMVFRYGIQTGKCERDAAADLKGALKTHKTEHFRTLELKDLPEFMKALERNEVRLFERTRRAVWLSLYTFCRPGEIRQARWSEIDFDECLWIIPAERMKMRRPHVVPLSSQALAILQEQRHELAELKTDYVFPSQINWKKPMSDGTVNKAIQRLGYGKELVAHGFRALARTTIRERLGFSSEVIEKQLAHKSPGPLGEAYDRTQFIDERKKMMQAWANFLDAQSAENVIQAKFGRAG